MFCRNCGTQIDNPNAKFCKNCGAPLSVPVPAAAEETVIKTANAAEQEVIQAEQQAAEVVEQATADAETAVQEQADAISKAAEEVEKAAEEQVAGLEAAAAEAEKAAETYQQAAEEAAGAVGAAADQVGGVQSPIYTAPAAPQQTYQQPVYLQPQQPQQPVYQQPAYQQPQPAAAKESGLKKLFKNKFFYIGLGVVVVAVVALILILGAPKSFDLNNYLTVEYEGYNGRGEVYAYVDEYTLSEDIAAAKKLNIDSINSLNALGSSLQKVYAIEQVVDSISVSCDPAYDVSNGDEVKITITYDQNTAKSQKIKFTGTDSTVTVSGLPELQQIDPFKDLEVTFSGTSGSGYVDFSYSGSDGMLSSYSFNCDKWYDLSNGDVITVDLNDYDDDYTAYYGYIITNKEQQYTVSGLTEYATDFADISATGLEALKADGIAKVKEELAYYSDFTASEPVYAGYAFAAAKDASSYNKNYMYMIYKATVTSTDGSLLPSTVYVPLKYDDVMKGTDDLDEIAYYYYIDGYTYINNSWTSVCGYTDPYALCSSFTDYCGEDYNVTFGDGFEAYSSGDGAVTALADIDDQTMSTLSDYGMEMVKEYLAENADEGYTTTGLKLAGEYLLINNDDTVGGDSRALLVMIYEGTLSDAEKRFPDTTVYYPMEFDGVIKTADGVYVYYIGDVFGSSYIGDTEYVTDGFTSGQAMHAAFVEAMGTTYSYEMSDSLKAFAQ